MRYSSKEAETNAAMQVAERMVAAARTAPKACAIDTIEALILDGADKDELSEAMRALGTRTGHRYYARDAGNVDDCHCIVLIGASVEPRSLNCGLCGVAHCAAAITSRIPCALVVTDLGIAVGSAAATAMDHRIDNRILFTAGMAALHLKTFPETVKICYGIGLATSGKNIFFDRPAG